MDYKCLMKLIGSLTSPFARKVRIFLLEKKIPFEMVIDVPWKEDTKVPAYNPLGKIPVLILDDGKPLIDSRVIVQYLEEYKPAPSLIPTKNHIEIKYWEALADGVAEAAANYYIEKNMRETKLQSEAWQARQLQKVNRGIKFLSAKLANNLYCVGNTLSLADIALVCALGYLSFRLPQIFWQKDFENLKKFYDLLSQRQTFQETIPH